MLNFERVGAHACRLRQLVNRLIDVVVDQEIEAEHVMGCLAQAASINPAAVPQFVTLPRLADDEAEQQREQSREQWQVLAHVEA